MRQNRFDDGHSAGRHGARCRSRSSFGGLRRGTLSAFGLVAASLLPGCDAPNGADLTIPRIAPAAVPAEADLQARGPLRLVLGDVRFRTNLGALVRIDSVEVVGESGEVGLDRIELGLVRIVGLDVHAPPDSVPTPFDPFVVYPGPRLVVHTLRIEGATLGGEAFPGQAPGKWFWRVPRLDLVASDIRLGGDDVEGFALDALRVVGELQGEPFAVRSATGRVTRHDGLLRYTASTTLPSSRLAAAGSIRQHVGFAIDANADTLAFRDVHAFVDDLPASGGAVFDVSAAGSDDGARIDIAWLAAAWPAAAFDAIGTVDTREDGGADGLRVRLSRYDAPSREDLAGTAFDVAGRWSGALRADGLFRDGVRVEADLMRAEGGPGVRSAVADGVLLRLDDLVDVAMNVDALLAAPDTAEVIVDDAGDNGEGATPRHDGITLIGVEATITGIASLEDHGPLDLVARIDSVPIELAPLPAAIDSARGLATATVRVAGTPADPVWSARVDLADGALFLRPVAVPVTSIAATARVDADTLWLDAVTARAADGVIAGSGTIALGEPRTLALDVTVDSLRFEPAAGPRADSAGIADLRGGVDADVRIGGTLDEPRLAGEVRVRDGGLVVERTNMRVDSLDARIRLDGESAVIDSLGARVGGGRALATGVIDWSGASTVMRVALGLDSARVIDTDSVSLTASARIEAAGTLDRPTVDGTVVLLDGRVHEDVLARDPPIDLDDPEYADLAARAPWPDSSRLRLAWAARDTAPREPRFDGELLVEIRRNVLLVDEDSELGGTGTLRVSADSAGLTFDGVYRLDTGAFVQYGDVMEVVGGAITFNGGGFVPRVTVRQEQRLDRPLAIAYATELSPLEDLPRVESFAIGTTAAASEEVRRLSLLPETKPELAARLLYGVEPIVVTGLDARPFFLTDGFGVADTRARTQGTALLYAYAANELYDFVPPSRAGLRSDYVAVGSPYPGRIIVAPIMTASARFGSMWAQLAQPIGAGAAPGLRLRFGMGDGLEFMLFDEPRFHAAAPGGYDFPGFTVQRMRGLGFRWDFER